MNGPMDRVMDGSTNGPTNGTTDSPKHESTSEPIDESMDKLTGGTISYYEYYYCCDCINTKYVLYELLSNFQKQDDVKNWVCFQN